MLCAFYSGRSAGWAEVNPGVPASSGTSSSLSPRNWLEVLTGARIFSRLHTCTGGA